MWSKAIFDSLAGDTSRACADKIQDFGVYAMNMCKRKRTDARHDLISQLVQVEENGSRLTDEELVAMIALLIFAGHETTANLISNGVLTLLMHPNELARVRQDPTLVPAAVEEILRFQGSVTGTSPRYATEDVELGGQLIRRGEVVLVSLAAANRDEAEFSHPDTFEITRTEGKHLTFGQGIHYCLGRRWRVWRCRSPSARCSSDCRTCDLPWPPRPCAGAATRTRADVLPPGHLLNLRGGGIKKPNFLPSLAGR